MGLHKRHTHGRVFRGLEAREQLRIRKRDSHGDNPVMHVPTGFDGQQSNPSGNNEVVSVVYVTLPQTFAGPAVFSTMTGNLDAAPAVATPTAQPTHADTSETPHNTAQGGSAMSTSVATVSPSKLNSPSNTATLTSLLTATTSAIGGMNHVANSGSQGATILAGNPIQATQSPTSQAISESSNGMSGGAKAGLAFGIIIAIALGAGLIFFCWRRKKNAKAAEQELQNEKHGSFVDAGARQVEAGAKRGSTITEKVPASLRSTRTASTAPRLSLRPVTQFLPNLGENRKSSGNTLDVAAAGLSEKPKSPWERRPQHADRNPFDDAPVLNERQARPESPQANPFDEPEGKKSSDSQQANGMAPAMNGNPRYSPGSSWEGTEPPTPKSAQFGTAAAVPISAGASRDPPPPRGPNNVHRVQLDFKPSMDDELELRSGQLVRMLHEYDDGWALCIRMDRSQQGVAPRTCLSKLPVKPRPQGPPPNSRPGTAHGPRRPSNPPHPSHGHGNGPMYPRPLTPTQANRSPSPPQVNGQNSTSPTGVVPQRKPVPGQAM